MLTKPVLEALQAKYEWPEIPDNIKSYDFSLDGGGRHLITDLIHRTKADVVLEIGCFLGGSVLQWLRCSKDLVLLGVDPWDWDFAGAIERFMDNPAIDSCFSQIPDRMEFLESVRTHGGYLSALANLREYRDRFLPIRGHSPEVLHEIAEIGVIPDVVYVDSNKHLDDLEVSDRLFPQSVLCGDDWTWGKDEGYPVRRAVKVFAKDNGFDIKTSGATWVLKKRS